MSDNYTYKFGIKVEKLFGFSIGVAFSILPKDINNKRETYLIINLGVLGISIGYITKFEDE